MTTSFIILIYVAACIFMPTVVTLLRMIFLSSFGVEYWREDNHTGDSWGAYDGRILSRNEALHRWKNYELPGKFSFYVFVSHLTDKGCYRKWVRISNILSFFWIWGYPIYLLRNLVVYLWKLI